MNPKANRSRSKRLTRLEFGISKNTGTLIVSVALIIGCVIGLVAIPVDFVTWSPGKTYNISGETNGEPVIKIEGVPTFETSDQILMTTIAVSKADAKVNLIAALTAQWDPYKQVLPREYIYPPGQSAERIQQNDLELMSSSQDAAVVAALRAADVKVEEIPMVAAVTETGPAVDKLFPGDLILKVDGVPVASVDSVRKEIRKHQVGDIVVVEIERDSQSEIVELQAVSSANDVKVPVIGISLGMGYRYQPTFSFSVPSNIVGPSGGLAFSLAIYDQLTPGDLMGGKKIAVTGEVWPTGEVSSIGGVNQKIKAAEMGEAEVILIPETNCADLEDRTHKIRVVPVTSLKESIAFLEILKNDFNSSKVPSC